MVTAITFIIILVILVLIHELGHFFVAKKNGVLVEEFGFGFPPRIFGKKIGETIYSINAIPLGGFVKLYGEEYHEDGKTKGKKEIPTHRAFVNKKPWQKTLIIIGGVVMNFLLGWVIISYLFTTGIPAPAGVGIIEIQPGSPAEEVGLQTGDRILDLKTKAETYEINSTLDLITATEELAGRRTQITVARDGTARAFILTPRENPPEGQGSLGVVIEQLLETKKYPWYQAPFYGLVEAFTMTRTIAVELIKIPVQFITERQTDVEFSGPVGIAKIVGEARKFGLSALLQITALLSLNLAVINILPFPALDGGRLVFVMYEWISGKRPNQNLERYMNLIGIILLLSLSVLITVYDIQRLW